MVTENLHKSAIAFKPLSAQLSNFIIDGDFGYEKNDILQLMFQRPNLYSP